MSGPVTEVDAQPDVAEASHPTPACVEVVDSHETVVGEFRVRRALPRRGRRTVGAWCFADHMGPASVTEDRGLDVGPHPHMGLQTVTWLVEGHVLHRDSLGYEQIIRPGQLNLMTAGGGIAHSEEATGQYRGTLEGIQLWTAQPDATRNGDSGFEHHEQLPQVDLPGVDVTVLVGEFDGHRSPARHDTPLVGADLAMHGGAVIPLRPEWEYALVVLRGAVGIHGQELAPGALGYLGEGRDELHLVGDEGTRVILLGGEPFDEPILMWWNFVARTREEMTQAYRDWQAQSERFGQVASPLARIPAPAPHWR
jgi:quercetin 2,3-dioxygenase